MLIDIEKYVRQLLPPNRREPVSVALVTMLLWPVRFLVEAFNSFRNKCLYDIGQPGQLAVLQFRLRELVDANIQVLDADGFRLDFRVIVPDLTPDRERQVRALVEIYRLRSKRYEIKESIDWSAGDGVRWWAAFPTIDMYPDDIIAVAIALDGLTEEKNYRTRIVDPNGNTVMDAYILYKQTDPTKFFVVPKVPGTFKVYVGPLSATLLLDIEESEFDLTWADYHHAEPSASLQTRVQDGVRQLYIMLYSSRANIAPFTTRVYDNASNLVETFVWQNPQGQWHNLQAPGLPDGQYYVEVVDKEGGVTPRRAITFSTVVTSLAVSGLSSVLQTDRYRVSFVISGGTASYIVQFRNSSNTLLHEAGISSSGAGQIVLPPSIGAQTLNVKVLDSSSPVQEATGVVVLSAGSIGVPAVPHGVSTTKSPDNLREMRHITGFRIEWYLANDGKLSDNFGDDFYTSGRRQADYLGTTYNIFYSINHNWLKDDDGDDIDFKDIQLEPGLYYVIKYYVRASMFPDTETIDANRLAMSPEDNDLWTIAPSEILIL